ncbi:DUF962-domain-containing protein [Auriscalpium vulgare]|uniref:DUF962-domain-containing protein n=1 Tax=Auriscalpium vulgare TaxID=40419 RepID=A0ACB8RRZ6_9AGAM|nr:DUF962-domain-containing protein [Auriscalpium vulgare]
MLPQLATIAYHANPTNILIHVVFVPIIVWTLKVFQAGGRSDTPFVPEIHYTFNEYLAFDINWSYTLEPVAAALYTPQWILSTLSAAAFSKTGDHLIVAAVAHGVAWIAQFIGHGVAEGRAPGPALLDNLLAAVVLAPFFVHLEILFTLGYRPEMHKQLKNDVGKEILRIKTIEGDKKRAWKEL